MLRSTITVKGEDISDQKDSHRCIKHGERDHTRPKTGDTTNILLYSTIALISGVVLLVFGILSMKKRRENEKGEAEVMKKLKMILTSLLTVCMLFGSSVISVFAAEQEYTIRQPSMQAIREPFQGLTSLSVECIGSPVHHSGHDRVVVKRPEIR